VKPFYLSSETVLPFKCNLHRYGTDTYLRYQLREKLRTLKQDDREIKKEGVENLSVAELQSASRARGMRSDTSDRPTLELQIKDWLELSLDRKLPSVGPRTS
jgi:LETM1 and EF-hand domain-containing protein 1